MPETTLLCGEVCRVSEACAGGSKCGLCPLTRFYAAEALRLPEIREIAEDEIPQPQRRLLAHERDMTSTLEEFHLCRTHLRVLRQTAVDGVLHREVLLTPNGSNRPVEFGAISIQLALLPNAVQKEILQAYRPLGGLLREHSVSYISRPKAYIRVAADRSVAEALALDSPTSLYGRCNALLTPEGRVLADIVEILPP